MGSILPPESLAKIGYFETHNPVWSANATALGTSTTEMTALTTKTTAARDAYDAQQLAKEQYRTATSAYHDAVRAMTLAGTDVIKKIKAKAAVEGNTIYDLALIPPPATPSPAPPPGQPTNFTATLDPSGVLHLAWKCANPPGTSGTVYQVARRIGPTGDFVMIGVAGERKFDDPGVPAGTAEVTYRIVALRSTVFGTLNQFTVMFGAAPAGAGGGGAITASVLAEPKLAA